MRASGSPGGFLARARGSSLGVKLALLSAGLTAVVVGTAFAALRMRTEANVRRVFVAELDASQLALRRLQDRNRQLLLSTASLVSTSPTLRAALQTWRTETDAGAALATIQREVERIFAELDRDLLVVTDDSGRVVAAVGPLGTPARGQSLLRFPAVRSALLSETTRSDSAFGVLRLPKGPLQVGCVAILVDGYPIGTLLLGERIDRIMPGPDAENDIKAVVTDGDRVVASTLHRAPPGARWLAGAPEHADAASIIRLEGEDYVTASLPLGLGDDDRPAVLYLMRSLNASIDPITQPLARSFLIAGLLAVLLVGTGGAVISGTTLRPLSRFLAFMRAGAASGTSETFSDPRAPAEVATLTEAYNRLIASLNRERRQLQQSTVELATTNETLRRQVEERERAERALKDSEEQLRQSQKLEALGALAGGVAHDFNNLLSVILGYSQFMIEELPESRQRADVQLINDAGQRAKVLVQQLLAFSRKQVLQPQIVDLNRVVAGMRALLRPLLGEDILVETRLAPELARVMADPGQIEQVILNLAVNARDAMPAGGTLVIETGNVQLGGGEDGQPLPGGPAVMLAVHDTGTGMDSATRQRVFEPFFTTKPVGKGTGLGLATVYGIVRQSEGNITVFSEPGQGSIFRCYFPPAVEPSLKDIAEPLALEPAAGNETILIAEDEGEVRGLLRRALTRQGYTVLEASHGREALELAAAYEGSIDLLVTDVVMPFVSGIELAERLTEVRPALQVLFLSGYSGEAVERQGVLTPDSVFLQKPILPDVLARTVREMLDVALAPEKRG